MKKPDEQVAFLATLDQHKGIVHKVANAYASGTDREDLVQDIIVQLWRSFNRYDPQYKMSTFIYRIALNVAISSLRKSGSRINDTVPIEEQLLQFQDISEGGRQEDLQLLQTLIQGLKPLDRALMLLYLDGNSHQEIAEILGITASNVGTKIGRIKKHLKQQFENLNRL